MCFRPPTIELEDVKCASCGEMIPASAPACSKCGAKQAINAAVAPPPVSSMGGVRVPGAPSAPKAPGASSVPGIPGAPVASNVSVPKAPGA